MSTGKEIRFKIKSVQNTQKITKAMQMVAASKMRKTQKKMQSARPYAENIRRLMFNLAHMNGYTKNSVNFLRVPVETNSVGIVLITTDKGLCGGLNTNTIKVFYQKTQELLKEDVKIKVCLIGSKGLSAASKLNLDISGATIGLGDNPSIFNI